MVQIACVDAKDFPKEVQDYCIKNEIQIHYQNDVAFIEDDGNPFAEWLKKQGHEFQNKNGNYIAILST
uniref:Uncharacterized protein n=1 Tax=viral metagenome TaxID=1070528 RepID=A0A6H1ZM59_9ZZZZ